VHRDVSPKNVFVTYDGGVKLIDFGIVQAENKRSETSTGTVKGTVQYLSPEQVLAGDFDRRTDVFAASILLWELTTGRSLYTGAADYQIMTRIVEADAPAPSTVQPEYPPELEAIVMKGLAREPAGRFATAEELQLALEEFARTHQLPTSTIGLARFMREIFVEDVAAYESAKERGKLATRALAEITTTDKLRAPSEPPVAAAASAAQPKPTRKLAPRERRRRWPWLAAALVVVGLASGGWYLWRSDTPASSDAVAQPTPAQPDPPKEVIVPAAAAGSAAPAPAPAPVTPHAHRDRKSAATPAAKPTKPKPLTSRDLDAVLPPKP
jgi:serine/threonine-protein kinase